MNAKQTLLVAAIGGALLVAIGAFGAHGIPGYLARQNLPAETIELRIHNMEVGVRYHAYHVLAMIGLGLWMQQSGRTSCLAGPLFAVGVLLFSGCLYGYVLTGARYLVHIVPIGGIMLLLSWIIWAIQIAKSTSFSGHFPRRE